MVDDIGAETRREKTFGEREADRVGDALAERAGGRLDAGGVAVFGMTCGLGAELAELLQVIQRHVRIAGEIKQRIQQHRAVTGRQDEAIAVGPMRLLRIELQEFGEQNRGDVGHAHRQTGMARVRLFDRIHGQGPDGIRHVALSGGLFSHFSLCAVGFLNGAQHDGHPLPPSMRKSPGCSQDIAGIHRLERQDVDRSQALLLSFHDAADGAWRPGTIRWRGSDVQGIQRQRSCGQCAQSAGVDGRGAPAQRAARVPTNWHKRLSRLEQHHEELRKVAHEVEGRLERAMEYIRSLLAADQK